MKKYKTAKFLGAGFFQIEHNTAKAALYGFPSQKSTFNELHCAARRSERVKAWLEHFVQVWSHQDPSVSLSTEQVCKHITKFTSLSFLLHGTHNCTLLEHKHFTIHRYIAQALCDKMLTFHYKDMHGCTI